MGKYIKEKVRKNPADQLLNRLSLCDLLCDFDAVSLYSSAIWDEKSINPKIETGYVFTKDMNNKLYNKIIIQIFTQGSAISKTRFYNPKDLIIQHLPVREKVRKYVIKRMRNGCQIDILTSVDIQERIKMGVMVVEILEVVI